MEEVDLIAHRLSMAGVGFHLSEVKGLVMDALKQSDFFKHFTGKVFLSQFEAVRDLGSLERNSGSEAKERRIGDAHAAVAR